MLTLYLTVGWIMVAAFLVILVITILSMLSVINLDEAFRTKLFYALILEVIAAVIFMFRQGPQLSFNLDKVPESYVFNQAGMPVPFSLGEGLAFAELDADTYRSVKRIVEVSHDTLFIKARDGETLLGYVPVPEELQKSTLPADYQLYIGLHLCADGKDLRKGKEMIFAALDAPEIPQPEKRKGVKQLFQIMSTAFDHHEDFDRLIKATTAYTIGNIKYKEIAEIYSTAADKMQSSDVAQNESLAAVRDHHRLQAIDRYLYYLKIQRPDPDNEAITRLRRSSLEAAASLFERIRGTYGKISEKKAHILAAASRHDVPAIESYMSFISAYLGDLAAHPR